MKQTHGDNYTWNIHTVVINLCNTCSNAEACMGDQLK